MDAGCAVTGVQHYRESLVLTVLAVEPVLTPQHYVTTRLRLENRGSSALEFCIDDTDGSLIPRDGSQCLNSAVFSSHHTCDHRVKLRPGARFDWQRRFLPSSCPSNHRCVTASIRISNPMDCLYSDCASTELQSSIPLCTEVPTR